MKRALKEAEKGGPSQIDDIFHVPEGPMKVKPKKNPYNPESDELLTGYQDLVSRDDKISFLADVKQKIKRQKLNDDDIPEDPIDFAEFQRQRILQRVKINSEIEALRNEKVRHLAKTDDKVKLTVDAHSRGHLLTHLKDSEDGKNEVKEEVKPTRITNWNDFVKQVRQKYYREDSEVVKDKETATQSSKKKTSDNGDVNGNESDNDLEETFHTINNEQSSAATADREFTDAGYSKSAAIESFVERFNKRSKS